MYCTLMVNINITTFFLFAFNFISMKIMVYLQSSVEDKATIF